MESEAQALKTALKAVDESGMPGVGYFRCVYKDVELNVAVSGEGKVNAAIAAALIAERIKPDVMLNFGVAGGLGRTAKGGKLIAGDVWEHDFDITAAGHTAGKYLGRTDDRLAETIIAAIGGERGTVATGDVFVADPVRAGAIAKTYGAAACEMECAAVFAAASACGIPFAAVKYISDDADSDAKTAMDDNVLSLAELIAADLMAVAENLSGTYRKS